MHYENEVHHNLEDHEAHIDENLKHDNVLDYPRVHNSEATSVDLHLVVAVVNHKGIFTQESVKTHEMPKIGVRMGKQDVQEDRFGVQGKEHRKPLFMLN